MNEPGVSLPPASAALHGFVTVLREHGFSIAPEQVVSFLAAVPLLGPRDIERVRLAARATLAPPPERTEEFDLLFDACFFDLASEAPATLETTAAERDESEVLDVERAALTAEVVDIEQSGRASTYGEVAGARTFAEQADDERLGELSRRLPATLPRRRGFRLRSASRGAFIDMRRTLRSAIRHDAEMVRLYRRSRRRDTRKVLLLIDISGSMKTHTEALMRIAHTVVQATRRVEVFTFGTRLSRITRALRHRDERQALAIAGAAVSDWDGGTRIGEAMQAFFAIPRFSAYASGAVCVVISDGLERGDPDLLAHYVRRLERLSWRLAWLTPLAGDPAFSPETAALKAIAPLVDDLADGAGIAPVSRYLLHIGVDSRARRAEAAA